MKSFKSSAVFLAAALLALAHGAPAGRAQSPAQPSAPASDGRFAMTPADGGFLRLDTRTGAVSHCRMGEAGLQCRAGADERAALEAEVDRLSKENAELRGKLAALGDQSPGGRLRNALPSQEEMDRAMGWMESFMRRMMRLMREETPPGDRL